MRKQRIRCETAARAPGVLPPDAQTTNPGRLNPPEAAFLNACSIETSEFKHVCKFFCCRSHAVVSRGRQSVRRRGPRTRRQRAHWRRGQAAYLRRQCAPASATLDDFVREEISAAEVYLRNTMIWFQR